MSTTCTMMIEAVVVILLVSLTISDSKTSNASLIAQTQQGVYLGKQTTMNGVNVNFWYGIPYAQQPVGTLRWRPPLPLPKSKGTNNAYIPNACPQSFNFGIPITESCLTLNVYAPENAHHLPVYVWIHGGSFTLGAGIQYDAIPFVSTSIINSIPIIIVTVNYRIGLLGFLADQALYEERSGMKNKPTTGNYGILDQMMALDWIKKNINGFGGNPEQITVGGESAGGISVAILLTSPLVTQNSFQRAIMQSGNSWPNAVNNLEDAINRTGNILRKLAPCTTVQCLRTLTVDAILMVQNIIVSQNIFGAAALPVIDGYVLNDTMDNNYAKGRFKKVPILVGSNTNESSLFTCPLFNQTASVIQVQAFFNLRYNPIIANKISTIYGSISTYSNPLAYLNTVFSDSSYHCGARRIASQFSRYGIPSYLYNYNYLIPITPPCLGVHHAAELVMFFPSLLPYFYPNYNLNALEQQFAANIRLYWASFIRTGNPNFVGNPGKWDAYLTSCDADFVLDLNLRMRNGYYQPTCSRLWDLYAVTNTTST